MPASVVFEGELTGTAKRVPPSGMDNCTERGGNIIDSGQDYYQCHPKAFQEQSFHHRQNPC